MKSRVSKNAELHQSLSTSVDHEIPSKELSHYANRLNEIDDQFKKIDVDASQNHQPQRAKQHEGSQGIREEAPLYDTFENTYLRDFLNEVKEYNVSKGYRSSDQTQEMPVSDLSPKPTQYFDEIRSVIEEAHFDTPSQEDVLQETRVFKSDDLNDDLDFVISSLDETQSLLKLDDLKVQSPIIETSVLEEPASLDAVAVNTQERIEVPREEMLHAPHEVAVDDTFKRDLMEQTQTLQHRILDQERNLEDMNDVIVHTNRMLHSVISLLLLALFVVIVLIVSQILR